MGCNLCNFVNSLGETLSDLQFETIFTVSQIPSNPSISLTRYCQSFRFGSRMQELGEGEQGGKLQN